MLDAIQNELQFRFGTKGALEGSVQRDNATGDYEPNLLQRALGVDKQQLENAANTGERNRFKNTDLGREASSYGVEIGSGPVNYTNIRKGISDAKTRDALGQKIRMLGGTVGDATDIGVLAEMADTLDTERTNAKLENSPGWKREEGRYYDLQQEKLADRKDARDALTFSRQDAQNQRMFARRESALDRAQTQDLAILSQGHQMKIAQMNQDLAEKRMGYDRETRRMDKRDRMIAQLMAGIGSLGSAF